MVVIESSGALDLYVLFVDMVFGGFWFSVIGMALVMFIIMGFLGRISVYTCTWYIAMFILSMSLGYGFTTVNILISLSLILAFMFSLQGYLERKGQ